MNVKNLTKNTIGAAIIFTCMAAAVKCESSSAATYTLQYNTPDKLSVTVEAADYNKALYKAAHVCFNKLTGGTADKPGKYPGEEQGLNIIDTCANPLMYKGSTK